MERQAGLAWRSVFEDRARGAEGTKKRGVEMSIPIPVSDPDMPTAERLAGWLEEYVKWRVGERAFRESFADDDEPPSAGVDERVAERVAEEDDIRHFIGSLRGERS
jgi:hypothetical protein